MMFCECGGSCSSERNSLIGRAEQQEVLWLCRGQCCGAIRAAVADDDVPHTLRLQVRQCFLGHLAGADNQHGLVVETIEDAAAKLTNRYAGDRDAALSEFRFRPDAAGDADGSLEHRVCQRAAGFVVLCELIRVFDLADDLGLTQHHAVDTGSDGKQVSHGGWAAAFEKVLNELIDRHAVKIGEELGQFSVGRCIVGSFLSRIDFNPVAGRKNNSFGSWKPRPQFAVGAFQPLGRERKSFPDAQVCCLMVAVDDLENPEAEPEETGRRT